MSEQHAHEVGNKKKNPFNLNHMHRNVEEWCQDVYDARAYDSRSGTTSDSFSTYGSGRMLRGGSWGFSSGDARAGHRDGNFPFNHGISVGFRVVR
jgi:sulfatase modifying factor 1